MTEKAQDQTGEPTACFPGRSLKNLNASDSKKGTSYAYGKSFHNSTIELERGVVH